MTELYGSARPGSIVHPVCSLCLLVAGRIAVAGHRAATMMAFVGFAMFGFFTSLAPVLISGKLGITSHVVAGSVAFSVFAVAAIFQMSPHAGHAPHRFPKGSYSSP